jgi:tRNA(Ile)-lysidine synthase
MVTNRLSPILLANTFERTLDKILGCVCISTNGNSKTGISAFPAARTTVAESEMSFVSTSYPSAVSAIAVAYSGGLDSSVLLHLACKYAHSRGIKLFAFHVHHGINSDADAWFKHCKDECDRLNVAFAARYVDIKEHEANGVEAAARICRYAALGEMCSLNKVPLLLTAHHQDDQAETVLLQLLRGCGVAGLSGMDSANVAPRLLRNNSLVMARPLLDVSRHELADFVAINEISFVEDSSNIDPRYARNALRQNVMSLLTENFPGFQDRFVRTAQHMQSAQRLLVELAAQDLMVCQDGEWIEIDRLRKLSVDRIDNLLRYWFGVRGLNMPSTAWLNELRTQLLDAKIDAQLCVTHQSCHIRRYKGKVFITPKFDVDASTILPKSFRWNGEEQIHFPDYDGILHIEEAEEGIDADWLRHQHLSIRFRQGGERLKPAWNRPTKSLKYHYQSSDIPAWERERLPLVIACGQLLFAAGIGMDCRHLNRESKKRLRFWWQSSFAHCNTGER